MKADILELIKKRRLYFDGGMGTMLIDCGMPAGMTPEIFGYNNPQIIESIHRGYIDAGANIIKTNSFGINCLKYQNYKELIVSAVKTAKAAMQEREDVYLAFDVGPIGKMLSPFGDFDFLEAVSVFRKSVEAAVSLGVDIILIETMNDSYETKAAVLGAKEACDKPIFVTNVYDGRGKLMTGADPEAMICMLEGLGVSAIGMNCSLGPDKMLPLLEIFTKKSSLPVIVNPNAGLPRVEGGKTVFDCDSDSFSSQMQKMAELGANILGGCCGTTPDYIRKTVEKTKNTEYKYPEVKNITWVSSYTHAVEFGAHPVLIGERINPTGKPKLREALRANDTAYIVNEALGQEDAGAHILDVNVGLADISEKDMMVSVLKSVMAVTDLPLQIDSSSAEALGEGMKIYNGKPLVNSVNGKEEVMEKLFPLVKKYGAAVIALTLDENGIPEKAEGRVKIAEKIIDRATSYGIDKKDIIVDPLAMAVSADENSAKETLRAIAMLRDKGIVTSLGVSNVSFGLPGRDKINSSFFLLALQNGLCAAIMNPYSQAMTDAYFSYKALMGLDDGCREYIEKNQQQPTQKPKESQNDMTLYYAVRRGVSEKAAELAKAELAKKDPMAVINDILIPALNEIGKDFEEGKAYLPELLRSAESASIAFAEVKKSFPESKSNGKSVVLATVKGDIHDIGKNIVRTMLESYGFTVYDLGRDVPAERVLEAVRNTGARLVGLSALMTTTVESMRETILLLKEKADQVKIMVGGAVLTEEYAKMIGAHYYAKDAMESVRIAESFYKENS